jgi:preprotein translocase subunit SecE
MSMQIYKRSQGRYTRLTSGIATAAVVAIGCYRLYDRLGATVDNLWVVTMVPVAIFVVTSVLLYWLLNKPSVADFLIAAEGELKKVNWSSRKEIAVSTIVVIIVVVAMAVLLGATDLVFLFVFKKLIG